MTLAEPLQEKLSSWAPPGDGRHTWSESFPAAGWTVNLTADHNDRVATLAWDLTLDRSGDAPAGGVRPWAERVAGSGSGLMERLKLIEVDADRDEAILRSDAPTKKGATAFYYEVKLTGRTRAQVRRYQADTAAGGKREQVAYPLTHEALARLAGDIASD